MHKKHSRELIFIMDHHLLLLSILLSTICITCGALPDSPHHLTHQPERRARISGAIIGNVIRRTPHAEGTEGLLLYFGEDERRGRVDDIEASKCRFWILGKRNVVHMRYEMGVGMLEE